jgi:hypothetical protein
MAILNTAVIVTLKVFVDPLFSEGEFFPSLPNMQHYKWQSFCFFILTYGAIK